MAFFKRLFSPDYRAAVAAEAAGDYDLAAERYAVAGQKDAAVRVHLARADRAGTRQEEIEALRDALYWAEGPQRVKVAALLGRALFAKAKAEAISTARDRERTIEAAQLLFVGRDFSSAGEAFEAAGDGAGAARAYRAGGLVDKLEEVLRREHASSDRQRQERDAYADYELAQSSGERDAALAHLRRAIEVAENKAPLRPMLDDLESRIIASGRVRLRVRRGDELTVCGTHQLTLGRDALCDLVLRSPGVSRRHAQITIGEREHAFALRDLGSRNGTRVGNLAIERSLPLSGSGQFALGDHCTIDFSVRGQPPMLVLRIASGADAGMHLVAAGEGVHMGLADVAALDITIYFRQGRPILINPGRDFSLNGQKVAYGNAQLISGDALVIGGVEIDVL